ncbi:ECF transporter S component [Calidifontibacillus oryziterrae]|uniref:ECF transporter S component n=1 Tax=Calidifontibacillus oryziterrae TaxID=1191699 RepID=UPI0003079832|nr:ECF transporter S component [Calidifontibacillus oryziterrae]
MNKSSQKTRQTVTVAVLSSIAYLLMMLNFPLPGLPPFLKIDFSEVPALIAAIVFGPLAGVTVEAIKNILHYIIEGAMTGVPIDQAANFIAGLLFVLPVSYLYKKINSTKGLTFGLFVGTITMTFVMSVLNYFLILPAYTFFLNAPAMTTEEVKGMIVLGIMPFNLIKGITVALLFMLIFAKLKPWIINYSKSIAA